jgi:hypothetical protein
VKAEELFYKWSYKAPETWDNKFRELTQDGKAIPDTVLYPACLAEFEADLQAHIKEGS